MKKLFKKAISSILAFAIAITAVAQLTLSEGIGLTGTAVMAAAETTIPDGYTPVYTMEDLYNIRTNTSGKYIIMNDIDMSGTAKGGEWDGGKGWTPIPEFSGTINGAGHRLMNMNIFGSAGTYSGFIGKLLSTGTVKNIRFTNVDVNTTGGTDYGTVAGYSYGTITNCSVSGNIITNNSCTGGICGYIIPYQFGSSYSISKCYNSASITNGNYTGYSGGIVAYIQRYVYTQSYAPGYAYCYVSDCYNTGKIKNSKYNAGIAGFNYGYVEYSVNYADGRIDSSYNEDEFTYSRVGSSYYLSDATFGSSSHGTALSKSLMQQQASYTGLDFDKTWYMCPEHNRPELQSLPEIYEKNITGISFASLPNTLVYKQGDEISLDGAMLSVSADDGTTTNVSLFKNMLSGYDMSVLGKQTVTVTVGDLTATYQITVLPIDVSDITLSDDTLSLNKGETGTLTATVSPDNATDKTVIWTSSDETVATVDTEGKVTAVKVGTATIKATAGAKSAECVVTVKSPASEITLSDSSISIHSGDTKQLTATLSPEDCTDSVRWTSSNEEAATVDENGLVTAVKPGTAIITAAAQSGVMDICKVTVDAPAKSITFEEAEKIINIGDNVKLNVTVDPDYTTDTLTWSVDDSNICTVDDDGTITGYSKGTATVTVKATSGASATCKVIVNSPALSITLNKTSAKLEYGSTENLTYELFPLDSNDTVEWTTSDSSICLVNSNGMIKAVTPGTATITATTGSGKTATCIVTVVVSATSLTLDKSEVTMFTSDSSLTVNYTLSPSVTTDKITWTSSNTSVATVTDYASSSYIKITPKSYGTAVITGKTDSGITATCEVTVKVPATSVNMSKTSATLYVGKTVELSATMTPAETTDTITWKSSNTSVATVSATGVVTAKAKGTATITATTGSGKTATCKVTVIKPATAIKLSKTSLSLNKGNKTTLTYTLTPTDSKDTVTWKSSNTAIAKVSATGVVTAVAKGTATITATTGSGKTATCKVTVLIPSTSVKLSKTSLSLNKGKTYTLKATMSPSTTTDKVTWKSSNTKVATVSSTGVVKAIAKGTATITVTTTSGKKATCKVTVLIPSTSVKLSKTSATVIKGKTLTLKATMSPSTTTDKVTWKSSNTKVATVSSTGVVKAIAKGTCTITATTTSGKKATCKITVKEIKATGIKLSKTSATVAKGKTLTLKATLTPSNTTDKVTWKSSNTKVATVSSTGVVKGIKYGTCTITATINGKKATCKITVPKVKTTKITLNKTSANINVGKTVSLTATINPTNSDEACKWSVSDSSIATITTNGKTCTVKGKKAGTVTITAKSGTKSVSCKVTVKSGPETPSIDIEFVGESGMTYAIGIIFTNNKSKDIKILSDGARLYSSSSLTSNRNLNMVDYDYYKTTGKIRYLSSLTLYGGPGYNGMIFAVQGLYKEYVSRSSVLKLYFMYDGVKYYCLAGPNYGVKVYKA